MVVGDQSFRWRNPVNPREIGAGIFTKPIPHLGKSVYINPIPFVYVKRNIARKIKVLIWFFVRSTKVAILAQEEGVWS